MANKSYSIEQLVGLAADPSGTFLGGEIYFNTTATAVKVYDNSNSVWKYLRGATWFTGTAAPGTVTGSQVGDLYLNTATGDVYTLS